MLLIKRTLSLNNVRDSVNMDGKCAIFVLVPPVFIGITLDN
jgi:hypothetical protein